MFVHMDKAAIFFEAKWKKAIYVKGEKSFLQNVLGLILRNWQSALAREVKQPKFIYFSFKEQQIAVLKNSYNMWFQPKHVGTSRPNYGWINSAWDFGRTHME